jgi:peptide/nickel transport system substrate-binding protein
MDSPSDSNTRGTFSRERSLKRLSVLETLLARFSPGERLLLYAFTILLGASVLALLYGVNSEVSSEIPASGGAITEGVVGPARFINPILNMSKADEDLSALVYSGLTRALPDGTLVPDLASSYEISPDGTSYIFKIRRDATFQDGTPVTASDVLFTVHEAQNPDIKSPHRADWQGVTVSTPDQHTVIFKLSNAYAPFLQNTTLGILPAHLWKDTTPEEFPFNPLNVHPVGSGPYRTSAVETDSTGAATRYELTPFAHFTLGTAHLRRITFIVYPNDDALIKGFNQGQVNSVAGLSPRQLKDIKRTNIKTLQVALPRVFGVFLNQSHAPVLADASVRAALDAAIDKDRLVQEVLNGYGVPLNSPIPPGVLTHSQKSSATSTQVSTAYTQESIAKARAILESGGWKFDQANGVWTKGSAQLTFALSTADTPELNATADAVATAWRQAGIKVNVQVYSLSELNSTVIRPRSYDAVLFGEVVGRELDLYAFWHSSQRNDPGLNLSLYANAKADTLLSQARASTKQAGPRQALLQFASADPSGSAGGVLVFSRLPLCGSCEPQRNTAWRTHDACGAFPERIPVVQSCASFRSAASKKSAAT